MSDEAKTLEAIHELELRKEISEQMRSFLLNDLKYIRQDLEESKDEPMDAELGEIYRNHLINVFKIIDREINY